jgi:6-phosphogluconolactonase
VNVYATHIYSEKNLFCSRGLNSEWAPARAEPVSGKSMTIVRVKLPMKTKFNLLIGVAIIATHSGFIANAQVGSEATTLSGAVYTMTNDASANSILVYSRDSNGLLTFQGPVSTQGRGSGGILDPLQSQGSLALSQDGLFLFAANAGSGTITTFRVARSGLAFVGQANSGGEGPLSIAIHGDLLYVLNIANITGFRIQPSGSLSPIPSSTRFLATVGGRDLGDSDIAFNPSGSFLAVTERVANQIVVFPLQADGTTGTPVANNSNGNTPFACAFTPNGILVVTETAGAPGGGSAASSYAIAPGGTLQVISGSVPSQGAGACWNIITRDGRFGVLTNAGSSNETLFLVSDTGQLSFVSISSSGQNVAPLDTALSANGLFLYTLDGAAGSISEFRLDENSQTLTLLGTITNGLTGNSGLQGLAAF